VGNREVETFGIVRLPKSESLLNVRRFKEEFLTAAGVNLAPLADAVVYSVDLAGGIHLIALDNVSRKGEGFGDVPDAAPVGRLSDHFPDATDRHGSL
jgi:hypothetical protein